MIFSSKVARLLTLAVTMTLLLGGNLAAVPFSGSDQSSLAELEKQAPSAETFSAGSTPYMLEHLATFQFDDHYGSDVWGWQAPDGQQYAIMGISSGVVFVNATTLTVIDTVIGSGCLWQDMKTYGHYCYAISECGTGLRVIDMQFLPDSVSLLGTYPTTPLGNYTSHNASIDTV